MITVEQALAEILALVKPIQSELIPLSQASGRVLCQDVAAARNQPPFSSSAMDGYAVKSDDVETGAVLTVIGESAAGHGFDGNVAFGQAVRIFTGAPVPVGADRIVIQEDVTRDGDQITISDNIDEAIYVRAIGKDFKIGDHLSAPRVLTPADIALLAAMNISNVPVSRRPVVALIATGDELVMPGETPGPDQIIASNCFGLAAMMEAEGAQARILPIARDNEASLITAFELAADADLILTIGGASVGDHDLVAPVAEKLGMKRSFYKVAMRPGKPLMAGQLNNSIMLGLPGNPVSSMVCGTVFVLPALRKMLGLEETQPKLETATLAHDIPTNRQRKHYMRARVTDGKITVFGAQDSSLLTVLSDSNALLVREVNDPALNKGDLVSFIST